MTAEALYRDTESDISLIFAKRYKELFVNKFRRHGIQKIDRNGRVYYRNNQIGTVNMAMIYLALNEGLKSYAGYGVDAKEPRRSKWTVFDLDISRDLRKLIAETHDPAYKQQLEKLAWESIFLMADRLMSQLERWELKPVPVFSGGKGVHVYLLFDKKLPVEKAVNIGILMKYLTHKAEEGQLQEENFDYLGIESYPCPADVINISRGGTPHLVKLPLMLHRGANAYSRFMYRDQLKLGHWRPNSDLFQLAINRVETVLEVLDSCQLELEEAIAEAKAHPVEAEPTNHPSAETYLRINLEDGPKKIIERCRAMTNLVDSVKVKRHLNHNERLFILFNLLPFAGGEGDKTVHEIMKNASDYDFKKTQHFIDHARKSLYKPFLCENAQVKGICPLSEACDQVGRYRTPLGTVSGYTTTNRIRPIIADQTPEEPSASIDEIRDEIPGVIHDYLRNSPEKALLIKTDPGVGKTYSAANTLANLPEDLREDYSRIFWAGQRHDMFAEVVKHIPNIKQILPKIGQEYDDYQDYDNVREELLGLCVDDENRAKIKMMRDKGWTEKETEKVCVSCGIKTCPYFQQWNHLGSFFAPHQHLVTRKLQENTIPYDILVIDEDPANVFDVEIVVTQDDIDAMCAFIEEKTFARSNLALTLLHSLRRTIASCKKNFILGDEFIPKWDERIRLQRGIDLSQLELEEPQPQPQPQPQPDEGLHHLINQINRSRFWVDWGLFIELAEPEELPKNWFQPLFKIITNEKLPFEVEHNSRLVVKKQNNKMVLALLEALKFKNTSDPVIFLDASADPEQYRRLLDRELIVYEKRVKMQNPVIQLITGEYPKESLLGKSPGTERTRQKLIKYTRAIVDQGENTLIVAPKEVCKKVLTPAFKQKKPRRKYQIAHYWGYRGTNEFEKCDQVVLFGTANPNMDELYIGEQCRRLNEDFLSNEVERQYRRYGNSKVEGRTLRFKDSRMDLTLKRCKEEEMIQMIHRIRPLHNPEKKIWILTSTPLVDLPAEVTTVDDYDLSKILGLKGMESKGKNQTMNILVKAVQKLRYNHNTEFTTRKLADTAKVNLRTVQRFADDLCSEFSDLTHFHGGFRFNKGAEKSSEIDVQSGPFGN